MTCHQKYSSCNSFMQQIFMDCSLPGTVLGTENLAVFRDRPPRPHGASILGQGGTSHGLWVTFSLLPVSVQPVSGEFFPPSPFLNG